MEQKHDAGPPEAVPIPALQLADREQLHASLKPGMKPGSFSNWLQRAMKELGFPQPVRVGRRSCAWSVPEVAEWLASRPRKGVFAGRRSGASDRSIARG